IGVAGVPPMDKNTTAGKQIRRKIAEPAIREIQSIEGIKLGSSEFEKEIRPPATPSAPGNKIAGSDRSKDGDIFFDDDSFDAELIEENTEGDVGFTDADFSFDEEAGEESEDVVNQIAGERGQSPRGPAQSFEGASGNYRLNISRQDGRYLPRGNDAGLAAGGQQARQPQQAQTDAEEVQQAETGFAFSDLGEEQEEDLLVVNETTLNTFSFYRNLDSRLSFQQFRSKALTIPAPSIGDEGLGEKGFRKKYGVNPFVSTSRDHLSTFGMDVDNAAWGRTREILRRGELPQNEVVRVEEFVNNFTDERAGNPQSVFTVYTEGGPSPFGDRELELLQVTIKSRKLLPGERKNAVLTFAVDTSGSMAASEKLELLRESLRILVSNLSPNDRVAIVAFSTHAYVVLPHTSVRQRAHIMDAINSLSPDGGTNVEAGIDLAYRLAGESHDRKAANRVILCSDGVANLGSKGPEAILKRIQRFARDNMISLFTFAFGSGGRQAVQGDKMLQRLANEGDGRYQYVDTSKSAQDLFSLPDQLQFLASDAKIQVDFNPEAISHYRLLGYEKRDIADVDFRNDKIDAGEVGPGSTVTAIYEIKRARPSGSLGRIHLRYRDESSRRFEEVDFDLPTGVLAATIADTTDRFRFIASVAEFAEILRGSYYARNGSYGSILQVLDSNSAPWRTRVDWKEAHKLVSIAQGLSAVEHLQMLEGQEHFGN
ncbi:MAG: von Willebrand factor type A domain-containing protein, partial [Planctomycetota bacterium]